MTTKPLEHGYDGEGDSIRLMAAEARLDSVHVIQREVAKQFGIEVSEIVGQFRARKYSVPRQIAIWLSRETVKRENGKPISLPTLGRLFGGRDHSTILTALRKMHGEMERGKEIATQALELKRSISSH